MKVKDYLNQVNGNVTFIIQDIQEMEGVSGFHTDKYLTTPIRQSWEWEMSTSGLLDMIVVNKDCPPIDPTGLWNNQYNRGDLKCCMVTREETIRTRYSERQAEQMIEYYEKNVK